MTRLPKNLYEWSKVVGVLANYNPFSQRGPENTEYGIINYMHDMGTCYVTHRRKEHFFKKFQGFGISNTELEIAYMKRVYWVLIMYHKEDGSSIPYRIRLDNVRFLEEFNNNGDMQRIFPITSMESKTEEGWN